MKNIILLGLTSLLTDISSEMVYPLIGLYLASLNTSFAVIGLIEGIAESVASVLKVFSGNISDRFNRRKPFVTAGYSCSALGKILLFLSGAWPLVFAARFVDRFGKGVRVAPRDALISESIEEENKGRVFGLHRAMDTFGAMCGLLLAYYFVQKAAASGLVPYKKIFLFAVIPAIAGVMILFLVKEKKESAAPAEKIKFYDLKCLPVKAKLYIMFSAIFSLGNSSNQFLLLKSKNLGYGLSGIILLYFLHNLSYALFSYPAGVVADRLGKKYVISAGYMIYCAVYLFFAAITPQMKGLIWIPFAIYGIYMGLVEGQEKAFLSEIAPRNYRAFVLGLNYTVSGLMLFPASFIAGILWDAVGPHAPFVFGGIAAFVSSLLIMFLL